jgi:hypothetical protein
MIEGEIEISGQQDERRGLWLTFFTVFLLLIAAGAIFFVIKQRSGGTETGGSQVATSGEKDSSPKEEKKKTLLELATAPENSPDFKPNPELTALTTAPRDPFRKEISKINMDELSAPSAEN